MKQDSNTEKKKRGKEAKRYKKQELENDQKQRKKQKAKYDFKIWSVYTVPANILHYLIKFSQQPCNRI